MKLIADLHTAASEGLRNMDADVDSRKLSSNGTSISEQYLGMQSGRSRRDTSSDFSSLKTPDNVLSHINCIAAVLAVILAGGYATRLGKLGEDVPKALLPISGHPAINYLIDKLEDLRAVEEIIVSANLRFKPAFEKWLDRRRDDKIRIVCDSSFSETEKPGAVRALGRIAKSFSPSTDLFVACGDNVFTSTLNGLVQAHDAKGAPVIAVRRLGLSKTNEPKSAVVLDRNGRVVEYVEKSITTSETITGTCLYIFPERTVPRIWEYEKVTGKHDQPGELISWLCKRDLVYGYQLKGMWWDIGTPTGYSEAQSWFDTHPAASIQLRKFTSKKEP